MKYLCLGPIWAMSSRLSQQGVRATSPYLTPSMGPRQNDFDKPVAI